MPLISVMKFVNWITGTPTTLEDGLVAALASPIPATLSTALETVTGPIFNCQLSLSGANLLLSPYDGNVLFINGAAQTIPGAGVTLTPAGLVASTFYYIYAFMSGTTMTLEASTTAYATHTFGYKQKTGDATRTLVGAAATNAGIAFSDSSGSRLLLSWFNRRIKTSSTNFSVNRSITSAANTEINSEIRNSFICWANEDVVASAPCSYNLAAVASVVTALSLDGIVTIVQRQTNTNQVVSSTNNVVTPTGTILAGSITEAATHFLTLGANTASVATSYLSLTFCQINLSING